MKTPTLADLMKDKLGGMKLAVSHPPEREFQDWLQERGVRPEEQEVYDYRSAMMDKAERDSSGHWSSDYKYDFTDHPEMLASDLRTHPNIVVGGFHTQTGKRVPGAPLAGSLGELIRLGWPEETARQLWNSVTK